MSESERAAGRILFRAWRVLALAVALFLAVVAFFVLHTKSSPAPVEVSAAAAAVHSGAGTQQDASRQLVSGPEPAVFKSFVYDPAHASISVQGPCTDAYSAVLIYPVSIDYRASPLDARYNIEMPCDGKTFSRTIDLAQFAFSAGERYYIIRAQQGKTGQWYNPQ